jgi:hypothetical protein
MKKKFTNQNSKFENEGLLNDSFVSIKNEEKSEELSLDENLSVAVESVKWEKVKKKVILIEKSFN